ncbi:hypothetical protein SAMN04489724_3513 [Algoriphagus locisalis]|uniref:Lipoprotein n=1 Tax=Algoriphagus locisalis TaxID=305507 RepID=A0A1I7CWE7_9BACT|nr:hypothetical protein [Algoriphagus locisalis]SFU03744.1 hypothetical protein SAMN04489724_3513 [Algoriphagus locisalis]
MKYRRNFSVIALILFCSCTNDEINVPFNINSESEYSGTFETLDSDNIRGDVTLFINNGIYECSTNLPYGRSAGRLLIDDNSINFIDTLFFPVPALYGPSYPLSGDHQYNYDGKKLTIWKNKNVGEVKYELVLKN